LEVLEFADYDNPGLVKSGDEYYWINNKPEKEKEETNPTRAQKVPPTLNEYYNKYFSKRVRFI
jgi:hypothetical protein